MQNFLWLALFPVVLFIIGIAAAIIVFERQRPAGPESQLGYQPPPALSLLQRWEYAGSMDLPAELRHRAAHDGRPDLARAAAEAERLRWQRVTPLACLQAAEAEPPSSDPYAAWAPPRPSVMLAGVPDTGEYETVCVPAWTGETTAITTCPDCEARDDQPHSELCRFYTPAFLP